MTREIKPTNVAGRLRAPASKSSMQRAVACALLADGESILRSPSLCADSLAALSLAESLGARVERGDEAVRIQGAPASILEGRGGEVTVSCGESGLCIRMFSPIAALRPRKAILVAEGTLARRQVGMVAPPLEALGARCATERGFPPLCVTGPLRGGRAIVDAVASSQALTGLLIALPLAPEDSVLEVLGLASGGYIDLTLATMRAFGIETERESRGGRLAFRIEGRRRYRPADFAVEGDWSGAAFLLVAGAIAGAGSPLVVQGLELGSAQPDRAIVEALRDAGARISAMDGGLAALPSASGLRAFSFDATDRPDLFPPLVALAARCAGTSEIRGVSRLRGKESDRAAALVEEFAKLGVKIDIEGETMLVAGGKARSGRVDARGDHRIAMAVAVTALAAEGPVEIEGAECVAKSWPSFFADLSGVVAPGA
jgi:3-phosphoshikimate 1-carboxyvinyltransferase